MKIGQWNHLNVILQNDSGVYLDGLKFGKIFLPKRALRSKDVVENQPLRVFVYLDTDDQFIATQETPLIEVDQFAFLTVKEVNQVGAFMDWGLGKDLLLPYSQQQVPVEQGQKYNVFAFVDERTNRIVCSTKLHKFVEKQPVGLSVNQEVEVLIEAKTPLGLKGIINNAYWGVLFYADAFRRIEVGETIKAYIKTIRDDGKIDLSLQETGFKRIDPLSDLIFTDLQAAGGELPLNDKTPADVIYKQYQVSKKSFKMALGKLYKQKLITFTPTGIKAV